MSELTPGAAIGPYVIEDEIGRGGFATVYRANDARFGGPVAIKVLARHLAADPEAVEGFVAEARALRTVDDDSVVTVFDISSTADNCPFMVLQYADLGTLQDRLRGQSAPVDRLVELVCFLGHSLNALHERHLIHRDVKPSNVLVTSGPGGVERFVLGDLGLVKDLSAGSPITRGSGSAAYAAPEQRAVVSRVDERTDLFAASAVVAEAAMGRVRGAEESWDDVLGLIGRERPELASELRRGLASEPAHRPATAKTWAAGMLAALDNTPVHRAEPRRFVSFALAAAVAALVVLAGALWLTADRSDEPGRTAAVVAERIAPPGAPLAASPGEVAGADAESAGADDAPSVGGSLTISSMLPPDDPSLTDIADLAASEADIASVASPEGEDSPDGSVSTSTGDAAAAGSSPAAESQDADAVTGADTSSTDAPAAVATSLPAPTAQPAAAVATTPTVLPLPTPTPMPPTPTPPAAPAAPAPQPTATAVPTPTARPNPTAAPTPTTQPQPSSPVPADTCDEPDRGIASGAAPPGLKVRDVTDTTVTIEWATTADPYSIFIGSRYIDNGARNATQYVIEGLAPSTDHRIEVISHDATRGDGAVVCATTAAGPVGRPPVGLTMATGLSISARTGSSVTLTWTAATSGGRYLMHMGSRVAGQGFPQVRVPSGGNVSGTSYEFTNLDPGINVVGVRTVNNGNQSGLAWIEIPPAP